LLKKTLKRPMHIRFINAPEWKIRKKAVANNPVQGDTINIIQFAGLATDHLMVLCHDKLLGRPC
jgi:hypothetical protein